MSTLVLVRHGKTEWSSQNRFAGWADAPLSASGEREARAAGRALAAAGVQFRQAHTSYLSRAVRTLEIIQGELGQADLPVARNWRLNERHYGALQGLNKKETADKHGPVQVLKWRRSYDTAPPPLSRTDDRHPVNDRRYSDLPPEILPGTECLKDVVVRMLPYWYDRIVPDLVQGRRPIVVAHGNSLRALVKHLDGLTDQEVVDLNIPTGIPLVYSLDDSLRAVSRRYLGDPDAAAAAAEAVARQAG
jgi:2,3-bisphosphoglycerate-dependent phosphoglycerate mutase